jgi:hypothetical protein
LSAAQSARLHRRPAQHARGWPEDGPGPAIEQPRSCDPSRHPSIRNRESNSFKEAMGNRWESAARRPGTGAGGARGTSAILGQHHRGRGAQSTPSSTPIRRSTSSIEL